MAGSESPQRAVTRNDVARLAGVSSAVVSYVVNNGPRPVADATRARVLDAIDKLGYRPNAAARTLITGRSDLIGLVVPDIRNPYFAALAQAAETAARAHGVNLVLAQGATGALEQLFESLAGHQAAGIITASLPEPAALAVVARGRVPLVRLSLATPSEGTAIWPDYRGGARSAVRHLVEVHGHRRVALVIGSDHPERGDEPPDGREQGWRDALEDAGLTTEHLVRVHWSAAGGADAARLLATRHPAATAVFTSSDQQAIGLVSGLQGTGRSIPDDLALASFDGSPEAAYTVPALTTVNVPLAAMAEDAVAELLAPTGRSHRHETRLVTRRSCGCTPAA
ncbi:MAG: LacI family transcriptional regulator [Actinobacteria bacterium]|nr:LacI family transcriptional regulator [Actinomycetota bacterium]